MMYVTDCQECQQERAVPHKGAVPGLCRMNEASLPLRLRLQNVALLTVSFESRGSR